MFQKPKNLDKVLLERFALTSPDSRKDFDSLDELEAFVNEFEKQFPGYCDHCFVSRIVVFVENSENTD